MSSKSPSPLPTLTILEIPRSYFENSIRKNAAADEARLERFNQLLGTLMYANLSFAYRVEIAEHIEQICYLIRGGPAGIETLKSSFSSQFPDFRTATEICSRADHDYRNLSAALIRGVPKQTFGALNGLVRSMVQSGLSAVYQVWANAEQPAWFSRYLAGKRYSSAVAKAQRHESAESWSRGSRTITKVNAAARTASEHHAAAYRRMCSNRLLNCRVLLAFWGNEQSETGLRNGLSILLGAASQEDRHERMRYKILGGQVAVRMLEAALRLDPTITGTLMLPSEAVPLFEIPTMDIGLKQSNPAAFTTWTPVRECQHDGQQGVIPFVEGRVALGRALRDGCLTRQITYLTLEDLRRHTAILGMTGSGKTTTKNRIVIDAWANGIPSLMIEPAKTDARILMGAIPELRIFTVGLEHITPLRLNPFYVEEGIRVQLHMDLLHSCFMSAWPMYGILANHLRRVLFLTYASNGWDVLKDTRGELVTPEDFLRQAEAYSHRLPYGTQMNQDFRGAILTRAEE